MTFAYRHRLNLLSLLILELSDSRFAYKKALNSATLDATQGFRFSDCPFESYAAFTS